MLRLHADRFGCLDSHCALDVLTPVLPTRRLRAPGFVLDITSVLVEWKDNNGYTVPTATAATRLIVRPSKQNVGRIVRYWNPKKKKGSVCFLKATPGGAPPRLIGAG